MSISSNLKNMLFGKKLYTLLLIVTTINIIYFTMRGEYYLNIVFLFSFIVSFFLFDIINKKQELHITYILIISIITTYLVKYFMGINFRKKLIIEGVDNISNTENSVGFGMDNTNITGSIEEQEKEKQNLTMQINDIYLSNEKQIAELKKSLNDAKALQASKGISDDTAL